MNTIYNPWACAKTQLAISFFSDNRELQT